MTTPPLKIVGYINPLVADALRDPTSGINVTQLRAEKKASASEALVSFSDIQAAVAQRDAEIARLQSHLASALEVALSRADGTTCIHLVKQAFSLAKTTELTADEVVSRTVGELFQIMKGPEA